MSEKYEFHHAQGIYINISAIFDLIELFTCNEYREIVVDSLLYFHNHKKLRVHYRSLMSNHLHLNICTGQGKLSDILREFKTKASGSS